MLSKETGFLRSYGQNPYTGYDRIKQPPFLFRGPSDGWLPPIERVAAVSLKNVDAGFHFSTLEMGKVVNYTVGEQDLVVFFKAGTTSALDVRFIPDSKDIGSTAVFDSPVGDQLLTSKIGENVFVDNETGRVWKLLGEAGTGSLAGIQLTRIVHADHFWFSLGRLQSQYNGVPGPGRLVRNKTMCTVSGAKTAPWAPRFRRSRPGPTGQPAQGPSSPCTHKAA